MPALREPVGESLTTKWWAGIDWVTWMWDGPDHGAESLDVAHELVDQHATPLDKQTPFKLLRWNGWRIGAVRLGHSEASSMLQLSGRVADESWTRLRSSTGRPTRLDVQTTVQLPSSRPLFGRQLLRPSTHLRKVPESNRPRFGESRDSNGLFLGTVGDRTKARYLRVYDKGIESGTAPKGVVWRIEVEAKGKLAPKLWQDLTQAEDVARWSYDCCAEQWQCSGYSWRLPASSRGLPGLTVPPRDVPDAERMALWLQSSVRPAIQRLKGVYSREQLLEMIGLGERRDRFPYQATQPH